VGVSCKISSDQVSPSFSNTLWQTVAKDSAFFLPSLRPLAIDAAMLRPGK
jgi:hypothetical protein